MQVVTLLPSATEVVYALGREPVAVSHECDHPPAAREKPAVTRSRVDADASTREIDRQVLEADRGEGVYDVDIEVLRSADPDVVVTQGTCEVCAVDEVLVERAVDRIDADPRVVTTDPHRLADVFEDVRQVGRAIGRADRAEELVAELRDRVDRVRRRATEEDGRRNSDGDRDRDDAESDGDGGDGDGGDGDGGDADPERPRVAVLDWTDPPMVAGHWVPDLVELVGGEYGLANPGERSRPREWAELREYDPEVLVVAPCGFSVDQTRRNLSDLTDRPGWESLTAVREDRVHVVDGNHYLNRPGPRLVDSLEHLAGICRPDRFEAPPPDAARPLADLRRSDAAD